jgi:hypothetical protein
MRTIGYRHPKTSPRRDHPVTCDICGVRWLRSKCVRDPSGLLRCPDDQDGREAFELAEITARNAESLGYREPGHMDPGSVNEPEGEEAP